jgi:deaminated glutathione amidase
MGSFKAACVQYSSRPQIEANLDVSLKLARDAVGQGAKLIALPEYASGIVTEGGRLVPLARRESGHPFLREYTSFAREHGVWVLIGSLAIEQAASRVVNRSYLIDASGRVAATYDKIHLFDVDLAEDKSYRESETISPGDVAVVADTPWGGMGLAVCYDLRFPQLFRALAKAGAAILAIPAAFTRLTGQAHWHVLVRARAIENGAYVVAPCTNGDLVGGGECYGHSLIVDPWGEVLADGGEEDGVIIADIDPQAVAGARGRIPALTHDRDFSVISPAVEPRRAAS